MEQISSGDHLLFYPKTSNFSQLSSLPLCTGGHYPLLLSQSPLFPHELALAGSDFSMQMVDLSTAQVVSMNRGDFHTDKINALKHANMPGNEQLQHLIFSASADGKVKLWDRRNGQAVNGLAHSQNPRAAFYSVDCDQQNTVVAGTNSEMVFFDLRKMKMTMSYNSSHTDDVTGVRYHPTNKNWLISSSTDNLLCQFDFTNKPTRTEDDTLDGVYASEQPLIDCGFISSKNLLWALTSINTIEIITQENCDVYTKISKFPHDVGYVIGCGEDAFTNKFVVYCGNNKGEVYIYELQEDKSLALSDMILLGQETIVRNVLRVAQDQIALTTEAGDLKIFKYTPGGNKKYEFQEDEKMSEDPENGKKKSKGGFKPF